VVTDALWQELRKRQRDEEKAMEEEMAQKIKDQEVVAQAAAVAQTPRCALGFSMCLRR
jgi:hypothetical protein